jgi:UDP-GlcNAc:undecaprenyl-phosphate GlcNAc-1-phosphate transferase
MIYFFLFLITFLISLLLVPIAREIAFKLGVIDEPKDSRKIHQKTTALLGGWAVFLSFVAGTTLYLNAYHPSFLIVPFKFYMAIASGGLILMLGGFLDDKFNIAPKYQIIAPILATLVLIFSGIGIGINQVSNPFGHAFNLAFNFFGIPFSAIFVFLFVLGMIYTTKFLDGMDGLASGISFIASLALFFLSFTPKVNQPITASLAIIFCGATLGFLIYNFNPASIFLGESGSTFMGFMLGALSVLLGGKIATALLVMGIPIMDVAWVIVRRIWFGSSPFKADRKHLHFRLLDLGFSQRKTVLILYGIAALFGFLAVFLQSLGKLIALVMLFFVMIALAISTVIAYKHKYPHNPDKEQARQIKENL